MVQRQTNINTVVSIGGQIDASFPSATKRATSSLNVLKKAQADDRDEFRRLQRELRRTTKDTEAYAKIQQELSRIDLRITERGKEIRGLGLEAQEATREVGGLSNIFSSFGVGALGLGSVLGIGAFVRNFVQDRRELNDQALALDSTLREVIVTQRVFQTELGRDGEQSRAAALALAQLTQELNHPLLRGGRLQGLAQANVDLSRFNVGTLDVADTLQAILAQSDSLDWTILGRNIDANLLYFLRQINREGKDVNEILQSIRTDTAAFTEDDVRGYNNLLTILESIGVAADRAAGFLIAPPDPEPAQSASAFGETDPVREFFVAPSRSAQRTAIQQQRALNQAANDPLEYRALTFVQNNYGPISPEESARYVRQELENLVAEGTASR